MMSKEEIIDAVREEINNPDISEWYWDLIGYFVGNIAGIDIETFLNDGKVHDAAAAKLGITL